jgi:sulfide:quinone oxidoreductase
MASPRRVIVLGAGIGGTTVAQRLRRALPSTHRVVLVEREAQLLYQPSLLWLASGRRERAAIERPLRRQQRSGIEVVQGAVERIDPVARTVQVAGRELAGDYLVIALGAEQAPEALPGLAEAGCNFYRPEGAEALRDAVAGLASGRLVVLIAALPFKCPAAPYEMALLLDDGLRRRGRRGPVALALYSPEPGPMPVAGPAVSAQVRALVEAQQIAYHPEHAAVRVDPQARRIEFAGGASAAYDLLAYVPPHRAPEVVVAAGLTDASGWIPVDRATLETRFPGVFALGDVTTIPLAHGKPLPKAGVFAHAQAEAVASQLLQRIRGRGAASRFDGHGGCFVETGGGRAGFGSGNFYAEPAPQVRLQPPSRWQRLRKLLLERYWLGFRW